MKEKTDIKLTIKVTKTQLDDLNKYSKKMKMNRSQLMRNLIEAGLYDLKLMKNTGILSMAIKGVDILEVLKHALSKNKFKIENDSKLIIDL